ncbi:hypothetical protein GMMP13_900038 [Candidatus Magnetomoraceae bacterium gMMP-13]
MFSNNADQIKASRRQLETDGWPIKNVSSYLDGLYKYYLLEGIDMPYTQNMFIRDY